MKTPTNLIPRSARRTILRGVTAMFLIYASPADSNDAAPHPHPETKLLKNQITFVSAHERTDGKLGLLVSIVVGRDQPSILLSDLKVQAFDDSGNEMFVSPFAPNGLKSSDVKTFGKIGGEECVGHYVVDLGKGQHAAVIQITRDGEMEKFPVQIIMAAKEPPKIGR
jgi:hypothetical protein